MFVASIWGDAGFGECLPEIMMMFALSDFELLTSEILREN